jgi:hypothetical protein
MNISLYVYHAHMHPRLLRSAATLLILAPSFAACETRGGQAETEGLLLDSMLMIGQGNTDALKKRFANSIDNEVTSWLVDNLEKTEGTTEIGITGITHSKPTVNILMVRPLGFKTNEMEAKFIQSSIYHQDDKTTLNAGIGYRKILNDIPAILGVNTFYDLELPYSHQRISGGVEIKSKAFDLTANRYQRLSGWRETTNGYSEIPLNGHDFEVALLVPYTVSTYFRSKSFRWQNVENGADIVGTSYSISGQINQRFQLEVGRTSLNNYTASSFIKVTYQLNLGSSLPATTYTASKRESRERLKQRLYEKVRRENLIVKAQKRTGFRIVAVGY